MGGGEEYIANLEDRKRHSLREWVLLDLPNKEIERRFRNFLTSYVDENGDNVHASKIKRPTSPLSRSKTAHGRRAGGGGLIAPFVLAATVIWCGASAVKANSQNAPIAANFSRLVYNRVNKAGSSSMITVLSAKRNNFKLSGPYAGNYDSSTEALTAELQTVEPGGAWVNHAHTAILRALSDPRFAWINVVREPIDRAQSQYYYEVDADNRHASAEKINELRGSYPDQVCNCQRLEFSDCVERLVLTPNCSFWGHAERGHGWSTDSQMHYFCEKRDGPCTLEAAMRNYDDYLFVGITEELGLTLRVFEELLPSWFRGSSSNKIPRSRITSNVNRMTGTRQAGAVSKIARGLLERHPFFADEAIFYEFCRRKFWLAVDRLLGDTSGDVVPAAVVASSLTSIFESHSPLYVGHAGLHNASNMVHSIRSAAKKTPNVGGANLTWPVVERTVARSGHPMCALIRDNWACQGARYGAVLQSTPLFNQSLALGAFPRGARIIAQGNSYFAQKIDTILCNSRVDIWHDSGATNSLVAVDDENDIVLLLLDNHARWNRNQTATVAAIHASLMGAPSLVLLGDLNGNSHDSSPHYEHSYPSERRSFWRGTFPNAFVFEFGEALKGEWELPRGCEANFYDCRDNSNGTGTVGHDCMPGPINRVAEGMMSHMLAFIDVAKRRGGGGPR